MILRGLHLLLQHLLLLLHLSDWCSNSDLLIRFRCCQLKASHLLTKLRQLSVLLIQPIHSGVQDRRMIGASTDVRHKLAQIIDRVLDSGTT